MRSAHWLIRYLVAALVASAAIAVLYVPFIGPGLGVGLFVAVLFSAWQFGTGPGIVAAAVIECFAIYLVYLSGTLGAINRFIELGGMFGFGALLTLIVTALRTARTRAEANQQWLSTVLKSIGDAVIVTDSQGKIAFLNPAAESLCGWAGDDAHARPLPEVFRLINERTREPATNHWELVLAGKVVVDPVNSAVLIASDGVERPIDETAALIHNARDELNGAVIVFRDVTERRKHEANMLDASRRKDEFLAMLAHELRNPLAAVSNAAQLLQRPEAASFLGFCADIIDRQVRQLSRLVDDLLDVARITHGKIRFRPERIDLATLIRSASATVRPLIEERNHALGVNLESQRILIDADPHRLEQVIVNLLANAAKYTPPGGSIELTARRDGEHAVIQVRDNGLGISPELLPCIFELFTQGDRSLHRSEGGLGIGLTMVQKLIELHGGSVTAASGGPGQGSVFTVRLPAQPEEGEIAMPSPACSIGAEPVKPRVRATVRNAVGDSPDDRNQDTVLAFQSSLSPPGR